METGEKSLADFLRIYWRTGLFLAMALLITALAGCKNTPTAPSTSDLLSERLETQNFIFHYSQGDTVQASRQEAFHEWAVSLLQVTCPKKIDFYKYRDRNHMKVMTGKETNGWADTSAFAVHLIWPWDNHECVHLYTSLIGRPSDFFNEGIAVALSVDPSTNSFEAKWWSESVHYWAKKYKSDGSLLALDKILESNEFRKYDDMITYPEAGSFVRFEMDQYGLERFLALFRRGKRDDSKDAIKQAFQSLYGFSIEQAEKEWLEFLDKF